MRSKMSDLWSSKDLEKMNPHLIQCGNFVSIEFDLPLDVAQAMCYMGISVYGSIRAAVARDNEFMAEAHANNFIYTFLFMRERIGVPEKRMIDAMEYILNTIGPQAVEVGKKIAFEKMSKRNG